MGGMPPSWACLPRSRVLLACHCPIMCGHMPMQTSLPTLLPHPPQDAHCAMGRHPRAAARGGARAAARRRAVHVRSLQVGSTRDLGRPALQQLPCFATGRFCPRLRDMGGLAERRNECPGAQQANHCTPSEGPAGISLHPIRRIEEVMSSHASYPSFLLPPPSLPPPSFLAPVSTASPPLRAMPPLMQRCVAATQSGATVTLLMWRRGRRRRACA